jgi:phosphoglycolate phosphatase-like HAD superfamily hydrolase
MNTQLLNRVIIFDFDGVIVNSLSIRDASLRWALREFPDNKVEELIAYHKKNSGRSRFEKLEYFFNHILLTPATPKRINSYALEISNYAKNKVTSDMLDSSVLNIIKNHTNDMHIVSASLDIELKYICRKLGIDKYFVTINGVQNGETRKEDTVKKLIEVFEYDTTNVVLIGDSKQDYQAAQENEIMFLGHNFRNPEVGTIENLVTT